MAREVTDVQGQDRRNGPGCHLNDQGGDKQTEHQTGIFQRGKHLTGVQHLFFGYGGEIFPDAEKGQQEAGKQDDRRDEKYRAQAVAVCQ